MTPVTAEQIVALTKARRERHEALARALRDAWRSGDKSWLDLASIALDARQEEVTALQKRVEGLEGAGLSAKAFATIGTERVLRLAAEARADALSAALSEIAEHPGPYAEDAAWSRVNIAREALGIKA